MVPGKILWQDIAPGLLGGLLVFHCGSPGAEGREPWEEKECHSTTFVTFGNAERIVFSSSIFSAALMHFPLHLY